MKKLLFALTLLAFLFVIKPFMHDGYPFTHDGENHLARIANYSSAIKQGQIPPRWAPTFWGGYGYPVFNYNYPFANLMAFPLLALHLPVERTLIVLEIGALMIGAVGVYRFLRLQFGKEASMVGVIAYLTAPSLFNNLYVRGAIGEVMAYAVFPHVLTAIAYATKTRSRSTCCYLFISTLSLMLAHNIFVLLLIPFTGLYALSQIWHKTTLTKVFVLGTCVLAASASMFFWIPALVEKSLVPIDASSLLTESIHQFPTITQLLFSPFAFGYSYPSPVDSLSFSLGFVSVLSVCAVVIGAVTKRISLSRFQLTVLLLFLGSVMLMLPQAEIVWKAFPVLQYLQFPWRLLFVTALLGSYLTAFLFTHLQGKQVWFIVGVLLIAVIGTANKSVQTYLHHDDAYYYSFTQTSTVLDENKPNTFTFHSGDLAPQAPLFEHDAVVEIHRWNGSHHEYSVDAKQDQRVIEPTAYFPGWKTFVDGQEIDIQFDQADGRISYWLTAGKHSIKTVFTQRTPARLLGNTVSLLSFVIFGALLIWMKKYEKAVHHA